jgi:hypothetical protein
VKGRRTLTGTALGLGYLLALACIAGWLHLDATTINGLAIAGAGMVAALAGKGAVEAWRT